MKYLCAALAVLLAPSSGAAQAPAPAATASGAHATFRAATDLVALTVTVTGPDQQPVAGLDASDFVVLEDGVEQPLSFVSVSQVPLDLVLLVDASSSMSDKIAMAREAVRGLTRVLRPGDRVGLVEFRDGLVQRLPLTEDREAVHAALDRMTTRGGTALYNALYVSLSGLEKPAIGAASIRRQCIVVLSDGEDTSSLVGYDEVLEQARRRGVTVYAVALRSPVRVALARNRSDEMKALMEADYAMRTLARDTGGQAFFPAEVTELMNIYSVISSELGQQYAIGYTPSNTTRDGAWRRVLVRLPSRPGARLRTRAGYYAEPPRVVVAGRRFISQ